MRALFAALFVPLVTVSAIAQDRPPTLAARLADDNAAATTPADLELLLRLQQRTIIFHFLKNSS